MLKNCKICGKEYKLGIREWCSNVCYQKSYYREKVSDNRINTIRKCLWCKEDFENSLRFKFCKPSCRIDYWNNKKLKNFKKCKKCGEKFITGKGKLYCSDKCKPSGVIKDKSRLICVECKGEFFGQPHYKYCSKDCKNKVNNRRKKTICKIGKVCEYCGFDDTRAIHAHHINRAKDNEVMFLCANHHYIFHSIMGHGKKAESRSREEVLSTLKPARQAILDNDINFNLGKMMGSELNEVFNKGITTDVLDEVLDNPPIL